MLHEKEIQNTDVTIHEIADRFAERFVENQLRALSQFNNKLVDSTESDNDNWS